MQATANRIAGGDLTARVDLGRHPDDELAALARTLNGMTEAEWTESVRGAGRKSYRLTPKGKDHLDEWADLLDGLAAGLRDFVKDARTGTTSGRKAR